MIRRKYMTEDNRVLFYVAAMFYNSQSTNNKRDNIFRKVIEYVIVAMENKWFTCMELSTAIERNTHMLIVEDEIIGIITDGKNHWFDVDYSNEEYKVRLKKERYDYILSMEVKTLNSYVDEFIQLNGYELSVKDLINKFIYNFYCQNVNELGSILGNTNGFSQPLGVVNSDEENSIIQRFIDWENDGKNKLLIAIANYALEYQLVSGNSRLMEQKSLKNVFSGKKLYIDTNIIFYCLGINGDVYENSTRSFLAKCRECQEEIIISYYTDKELRQTIEHFANEIGHYNSPLIHNARIRYYISNKDVYAYYIRWANTKKVLTDAKFFKNHLLEKYEELINQFGIKVEHAEPLREEELQADPKFIEYESNIPCNSIINYDARNVYLIESKRNAGEKDLQTVNTIFISADKKLQEWDMRRKKMAPVVIAPNYWLLLLARLISRSDDDFKCFISYINMPTPEPIINNKEFFQVVKIINDIIEDVHQQENVLAIMVEEEFAFLNNNGDKRSPEFIRVKTEEEAQKIITEQVDCLTRQLTETIERVDSLEKKNTEQKIALIEKEEMSEKAQIKAYGDALKISELEKQLMDERKQNKIFRVIFFVAIMAIPVLFYCYELIDILVNKNPNPISWKVFYKLFHESILESENLQEQYITWLLKMETLIIALYEILMWLLGFGKKKKS